MTLTLADRVFETSTTQGTGTINLDGAVDGFQSFAAAGLNGKKVPYVITDGEDFEIGYGTFTAGTPDTLTRTNIRQSSNSDAAVYWGPGVRNVRLALSADYTVSRDENMNFIEGFGAGGGSANAHTVTLPVAPLAYSDGMEVSYFATAAISAAATVNVNSLGNKSIKINGSDPSSAVVASGNLVLLKYKSSSGWFELIYPVPVPVTDWNTIKVSATDSATGVVEKATAAEVAAETADKYPDAALLKHHQGVAKAWWNINASSGTPTLRDSYNVSSITDTAVGRYSVNLTSPMANTNYSIVLSGLTSGDGTPLLPIIEAGNPPTTSIIAIQVRSSTSIQLVDSGYSYGAIFGDI